MILGFSILVVFVAGWIICLWLNRDYESDFLACFMGGGLVVLVASLFALIPSWNIITLNANICECKLNTDVVAKQVEAQVSLIQAYTDKYPMEKELLSKYNPSVLLTLPEIKSNVFLTEQLKLLLAYKDKQYELQYKINECVAKKQMYRYWFVPKVTSID